MNREEQLHARLPSATFGLPLLQRLLTIGTEFLSIEASIRVVVVNTLCVVSALLACSFSIFIFTQSADYGVLAGGLAETVFFSIFIFLNRLGYYRLSAIAYIAVHCVALFYFAVLRGMVVEERLLLVFLIICCLLTLTRLWHIFGGIVLSVGILWFASVNEHYAWLPVRSMQPAAADPFHDLGTIALLALILVAVGLFKWQVDHVIQVVRRQNEKLKELIRRLDEKNEHLEEMVSQRTSELKEANDQVRQINERLEASNENLKKANERIQFFFEQLSHDMRSKLNSLIWVNAEMKKELNTGEEEMITYVNLQQTGLAGLHDMVADILTMKMIADGKFNTVVKQTIDTGKFLEGLARFAQYSANARQVEVCLSMDENLPSFIVTDPVKLEKIINNLANNAVKYARTQVILMVSATDRFLQIEVRDNGKGIAQEEQTKIFDKDYTSGDGTGQGLYIVHWLCSLMNIDLSFESRVGFGTVFRIKVPYESGTAEDLPVSSDAVPAEDLGGKHILIADDDYSVRFVLSKNLQRAGCVVTTVNDGTELVAAVRQLHVDLVIIDSKMPVMGGIEALKLLRAAGDLGGARVILLTGNNIQEELLKVDADEYLTKPINLDRLLLSASRLLEDPVAGDG